MIVGGFFTPATPVLVPEVGRGRERLAVQTVAALRRAGRLLRGLDPEALLVVVAGDRPVPLVRVPADGVLRRGFDAFGAPELQGTDPVRLDLADALVSAIRSADPAGAVGEADWPEAALVGLYFLAGRQPVPSVSLELPAGDLSLAAEAGRSIEAVATERDLRLAMVAAGELSSRLFPGAPGGYHPEAMAFDADVVSALAHRETERLAMLVPRGRDAGESGLAQLTALLIATPRHMKASMLSYEFPFGTGYLVAALVPGAYDARVQASRS
jgi:hypothetical protein